MITNTGMLEIKYWRPFWLHSFWIWYWQAQNYSTKSGLFTSTKPELKISKMDRLGIINKKSVLFPLPYWSEDSFPKWVGWDSRQDIWFYLLGLSSSLHWLVLVLFYALFVQWSILPLKDIFICAQSSGKAKNPTFFEVADCVEGSTQKVSLPKDVICAKRASKIIVQPNEM